MTDEPVEGRKAAMARVQPGAEARRDGHSKLVYDKETRTITRVDPHPGAEAEGLETTASGRMAWLAAETRDGLERGVIACLVRDVATLLADKARLKAENGRLQILADERDNLEEELERMTASEARLKGELAEAAGELEWRRVDSDNLAARTADLARLSDEVTAREAALAEAGISSSQDQQRLFHVEGALARSTVLLSEAVAREAAARAEERECLAKIFDAESLANEANGRYWAYKNAARICRARSAP